MGRVNMGTGITTTITITTTMIMTMVAIGIEGIITGIDAGGLAVCLRTRLAG